MFKTKFRVLLSKIKRLMHAAADFEGADVPPSGIRPPADPKGPPLYYFEISLFDLTDPKIFLKAPLAPKYSSLRGGGRRKNNSI